MFVVMGLIASPALAGDFDADVAASFRSAMVRSAMAGTAEAAPEVAKVALTTQAREAIAKLIAGGGKMVTDHPLLAKGSVAAVVLTGTYGTYLVVTKIGTVKEATKFAKEHKKAVAGSAAAVTAVAGLGVAQYTGAVDVRNVRNFVPSMETVKSYVPSMDSVSAYVPSLRNTAIGGTAVLATAGAAKLAHAKGLVTVPSVSSVRDAASTSVDTVRNVVRSDKAEQDGTEAKAAQVTSGLGLKYKARIAQATTVQALEDIARAFHSFEQKLGDEYAALTQLIQARTQQLA